MWGRSHENLEAEVSGSQKQNLGFYLTQWLLVGQSDQEVGLRTEIEMKRVTSQVPPTPRALALVELFSKQPSSRTNAFEKMDVILTFVLQEVVKYIYYLLLSQKQFFFPLVIRLRFCLEATHPYFRFMWIWCDPTHILDLGSRRGCCCSVAKLCLTICNPMDCSIPNFPVLHSLLEFTQMHAHWVSDAIPIILSSITGNKPMRFNSNLSALLGRDVCKLQINLINFWLSYVHRLGCIIKTISFSISGPVFLDVASFLGSFST